MNPPPPVQQKTNEKKGFQALLMQALKLSEFWPWDVKGCPNHQFQDSLNLSRSHLFQSCGLMSHSNECCNESFLGLVLPVALRRPSSRPRGRRRWVRGRRRQSTPFWQPPEHTQPEEERKTSNKNREHLHILTNAYWFALTCIWSVRRNSFILVTQISSFP
jgi:hypothetical protein